MSPSPARPKPSQYLSKAKISTPVASSHSVSRRHILDGIAPDIRERLILITAPAGFGKTTTMLQLHELFVARGMATAWLTLDDGDNDVSRFLAAFSAALRKVSGKRPLPADEAVGNADIAQWITELVADNPKPQAIFFDDFEALKNPVVEGLIARGIQIMPEGSCVVIGTRRLPDIGLASLRARGQLLELDVSQLRFSRQEADEFLQTKRALALSSDELSQLYNSTEGWAVALWLASLALEQRSDRGKFVGSFSGSNAAIASYLAEDVLARIPAKLREFLLRVSILDELEPDLCNKLVPDTDGRAVLEELEKQNLFVIPRDEEREVYSFNALFRDFLQNQLRRHHPDELARLHRIAADAYLDKGRPIKAIGHALGAGAGALVLALELIGDHVDELMSAGRLRLLAGFLDQIPVKQLVSQPRLRMIHAWCVTFTRGPQAALAMVDELDPGQLPAGSKADYLAIRPLLLAMMDRVDEAHQLAEAALASGEVESHPFAGAMLFQCLSQTCIIRGEHQRARGYVDAVRLQRSETVGEFGFVLAESADALIDLMGGRLRQATARMKLATERFAESRGGSRRDNALSSIQLAEMLYEHDECERAKALLQLYSPLIKDLGPPDALISSHVLLSRIALSEGDTDQALEWLTSLETTGLRLQIPRVLASARLERATLYLSLDRVDEALQELTLARQCYDWPDDFDYWYEANDTLYPDLVALRIQVRSGKAGAAIAPLKEQLKRAETSLRGRRALKLRLLLAEAQHRDGRKNMALRSLSRALKFADEEGFVRSILEEGKSLQVLVQELRGDDSAAPLPADQDRPSPEVVAQSLPDPLTKKELQVLTLLAEGLPNQSMAERLFISESTVRTHLRNINLKLQAGNRTQAIAIARKLGLVA